MTPPVASVEDRPGTRPTTPVPSRAPASTTQVRWFLPVLMLVIGNFMAVLDVTIVNVAVPAIQKDFGGSLDDVLWIATAYTLMLGVVVPVSSWLGDRFGLTRVYLLSLVGFAIGSALCGIAGNLAWLIVFRVIQAIPGGIMPVVAMTLVYRIVPREKLGTAMGVFGVGIIFGPAVGPVLGGYFVQYLDWRLVFYVNVPVGILGAIAAYFVLPKTPGSAGRRFDIPGFLCIAVGLFAILLAASEGSDWGWDGYRIRMLIVGGVLCLALFVVVELEVKQPLLDLTVFKIWPFSSSLVMLAVLQANLLGISFFVPVFLQQGQGKEAFDAGLLLLPQALMSGVLMPVVGKLYDKVGPRWLAVSGLLISGFGTYLLASVTADMTRADVILWTCVRGAGLGLSIMPIMTYGLAALPGRQTSEGSALNNVARQSAGALGLAALSALSVSQQAQLFSARGALMPSDGQTGPVSPDLFGRLYGEYRYLSGQVLAVSYANIFLVIAAATAACVLLAVFMRPPPANSPADRSAAAGGH
ncbi:MDR family MFS transporter [Pseudonocardia spinosispora]|uniref:MDR family MFS transporter n=1 Tax=Pseudonocardia spinosispora TaxID=103441 RepID=UPI00040F61F3|nr:MDR family MFS transporter [Pseudonocardia spinosispora]